jgi:hypothetical protein
MCTTCPEGTFCVERGTDCQPLRRKRVRNEKRMGKRDGFTSLVLQNHRF